MKHRALPGLGEFAVEIRNGCDYITVPRNQRMTQMLGSPWVDEMFHSLKRKLKKQGSIEKIRAADGGRVQIFKITPAQLGNQPGKKHKSRHQALQQAIWKAIKSFIKGHRHFVAQERRRKKHLPVRRACPAALAAKRVAAYSR